MHGYQHLHRGGTLSGMQAYRHMEDTEYILAHTALHNRAL
jgi:hypothetical protein